MNWPKVETVSDTFNTSKPTVSLKRKKDRVVKTVATTFNTIKLTKDLTKTPLLGPDNRNNNHLFHLKSYSRPSVTWMFQGISTNRLAHMLNGNKNRSYNIGMWNCRKGLINKENLPTTKL